MPGRCAGRQDPCQPGMGNRWLGSGRMRENPYSLKHPIRTDPVHAAMYTLFASIARLFSSAPAGADYPQQLMEEAGARFGRNPLQAAELRQAASAWLRVVR